MPFDRTLLLHNQHLQPPSLSLDLGLGAGLGVVLAAEQKNGPVRPREDAGPQREQPLFGLGAAVGFFHPGAELHLVVEAKLFGEPVEIVEVLLVRPFQVFLRFFYGFCGNEVRARGYVD